MKNTPNVDSYLSFVDAFAARALAERRPVHELLNEAMGHDEQADGFAEFRETLLNDVDVQRFEGLLAVGFFRNAPPRRRLGWFGLNADIQDVASNLALAAECEPYAPKQPLFMGSPALLHAIRGDLINETAICNVNGTEVYQVPGGYAKLVRQLIPAIPQWARDAHPHALRHVHLDPRELHVSMPLVALLEAAIVPADPTWLRSLALHSRTKSFAAYELQDCEPAADARQCIEYNIGGVRRLEVSANRRKADYLSMMLEELPCANAANGLMVGRCIHLDTNAAFGTSLAEAKVQHLDLALNVYKGQDRASRMRKTLQGGKAGDASYRTHLYRIEDVPLTSLFTLAAMFFRSETLLSEWMNDALKRQSPLPQN